jgi:hypothetical protein
MNQPTTLNCDIPAAISSANLSHESHFSTTIQGSSKAGILHDGMAGISKPVPEQAEHSFLVIINHL